MGVLVNYEKTKTLITINITIGTLAIVELYCKKHEISRSEFIRQAILDKLENEK